MNVYQIITDRIIKTLETGVIPWHKPWDSTRGMPRNFVTKKPYRGINVFLLSNHSFKSPYWMTFNQISGLGGSVKTGSKATPVIFWKLLKQNDELINPEGEDKDTKGGNSIPLLRYYNVFNIEQTNGISIPEEPIRTFNPIEECEKIVSAMPNRPEIQHSGNKAFYSPQKDFVNMPLQDSFYSREEYYSTIFHELTHSTGHKSRLSRPGVTNFHQFGDTNYSKEELVAEMGAAFLCAISGIENRTVDNSAAYISSWMKQLQNDHKLLIHAAAQAQRAVDFIVGNMNPAGS